MLIPNPINCADFTSEIVRRNETTLSNALIEPALVDGFRACRMVAAYDEARELLIRQQSEAAKLEELKVQRDQPAPGRGAGTIYSSTGGSGASGKRDDRSS